MLRQFPQAQARAQLTGQRRWRIQVLESLTEQEPWLPEKPPWLQPPLSALPGWNDLPVEDVNYD